MPNVRLNDITMYYEIQGEGEALILIAGLASDHTLYRGIVPVLSRKYQVVAFDNRGVGRTDKPRTPYSIEGMADDTAGLLNALGLAQAHVLGTSMGGRIALALALRHPSLVRSLILVSASAGPTPPGLSRALVRLLLLVPVLQRSLPYYAAVRQRQAALAFDCSDRLGEIRAPTLILHGKRDKLAPRRLVEEMQAGIEGSRLVTFRGGHLFFILQQRQVVGEVAGFLESVGTAPGSATETQPET